MRIFNWILSRADFNIIILNCMLLIKIFNLLYLSLLLFRILKKHIHMLHIIYFYFIIIYNLFPIFSIPSNVIYYQLRPLPFPLPIPIRIECIRIFTWHLCNWVRPQVQPSPQTERERPQSSGRDRLDIFKFGSSTRRWAAQSECVTASSAGFKVFL